MYEEFGEIINTMKFNNYDYTKNIRFWKIKELDGIGSTTYKNLFNYCKKQTTGERYEQLNLFD